MGLEERENEHEIYEREHHLSKRLAKSFWIFMACFELRFASLRYP